MFCAGGLEFDQHGIDRRARHRLERRSRIALTATRDRRWHQGAVVVHATLGRMGWARGTLRRTRCASLTFARREHHEKRTPCDSDVHVAHGCIERAGLGKSRDHVVATARGQLGTHDRDRARGLGKKIGRRWDLEPTRMTRPRDRDPIVDGGGLDRRFDA